MPRGADGVAERDGAIWPARISALVADFHGVRVGG